MSAHNNAKANPNAGNVTRESAVAALLTNLSESLLAPCGSAAASSL